MMTLNLLLAALAGGVVTSHLPDDARTVLQAYGVYVLAAAAALVIAMQRMPLERAAAPTAVKEAGTDNGKAPMTANEAMAAARERQQQKLAQGAAEAKKRAEERERQLREQRVREAAARPSSSSGPSTSRYTPPAFSPLAPSGGQQYRPANRNRG